MTTRYLIISFAFIICVFICDKGQSQSATPVNGSITTTNGTGINIASYYLQNMSLKDQSKYVKINTKIPFSNGVGMTSLYIDYWGYGRSWRTMVGWYVYAGNFLNPSIAIVGHYNHNKVILSNENGYVSISILVSAFSHYGNLTINSMIAGIYLPSTWMENWNFEVEVDPGTTNQTTVSIENMLSSNGNIGIGTTAPSQKLEIFNANGFNTNMESEAQDHISLSTNDPGNGGLFGGITWKSNGRRRAAIAATREHSDTDYVGIAFFTQGTDGVGPIYESMRISRSGNVGIGTTTPGNKLDVKGTIRAEEVKVETGWADYVFHEDYELKSLSEVSTYIQENHHLPGIPSAEEVAENGIKLGEMNAKLLEKVEELTLYLIEMKEEVDQLKLENSLQQKELDILKQSQP